MARVAGVDLPPNKRAQIGLTYIYGVGKSRATAVLDEASISQDVKIRDLSEDELNKIRAILDAQGDIEGDLHAERGGWKQARVVDQPVEQRAHARFHWLPPRDVSAHQGVSTHDWK